MNEPPLYTACVPVLLRYLAGLGRIVAAVEGLPNGAAQQVLLARLAPDMLAFHAQVETAAQFARRTAFPLAGKAVPPFVAAEKTFEALQQTIRQASHEVGALAPADFLEADARHIAEQAGSAALQMPAARFLHEYALPNFFFHLNMAYAIARAHGVALGKGSYDGFHLYPGGS